MKLSTYFSDFMCEIRLTENQRNDLITGHQTLRERLEQDEELSPFIVSTFLQGSYRRSTIVRPKGGKRSDVDVIVATRLDQNKFQNSEGAMRLFCPFLDKYYPDKYELQGRSIGIKLSYVEMDLVITSAPSEIEQRFLKSDSVTTVDTIEDATDWRLVESWVALNRRNGWATKALLEKALKEAEWQLAPLLIPDREARKWVPTHPLAQIKWTRTKNRNCNGHYVNVIKAVKWWRRVNHTDTEYPKGYPVEHLIGQCCPDGIDSIAEGFTLALEGLVERYQPYAMQKIVPNISDHGVNQNVLHHLTGEQFATFYNQVADAAKIARLGLDANDVYQSVKNWQELFGNEFPDASPKGSPGGSGPIKGGYTERTENTTIGEGRFA